MSSKVRADTTHNAKPAVFKYDGKFTLEAFIYGNFFNRIPHWASRLRSTKNILSPYYYSYSLPTITHYEAVFPSQNRVKFIIITDKLIIM